MKSLGRDDKQLMQLIQENMFVFDNLIMADDKSLQTLLRNVETELLVLSLKGADEPLREKYSLVCQQELRQIFRMKWVQWGLLD